MKANENKFFDPEAGWCLECGHPLQVVGYDKCQCPYCEQDESWWSLFLEKKAKKTFLDKIDWVQVVRFIDVDGDSQDTHQELLYTLSIRLGHLVRDLEREIKDKRYKGW